MNYEIRPARKKDQEFLWQMLYYAAHMDEQGVAAESPRTDPNLVYYVEDWSERPGDLGFIAIDEQGRPAGAAWIRVMPPSSPLHKHVTPGMPELAIAVLPALVGTGAGTMLLRHLLEAARGAHQSIVLSVRTSNPARRLYERLGFVRVAQIANRVGTESLVMRVDLNR